MEGWRGDTYETIGLVILDNLDKTKEELMIMLGLNDQQIRRYFRKLGLSTKDLPRGYNTRYFDEWSPNMAYILGFIYSDGCLTRRKTGYEELTINSTDVDIMNKIAKELNYTNTISVLKIEGRKDYYSIHLSNKYITNRIKELGVTYNKSLDTIDFSFIPEQYLSHFMRGFFDGDGGLSNRKIYFTVTTLETAKNLNKLLPTPLQIYNNGSIYNVLGSCFDRNKKVLQWMYFQSDIHMDRKYNKAVELCGLL